MRRESKNKTERELLYKNNLGKLQDFQVPKNENNKKYIRITHYMLQHENYKKLSSSAKVALMYMFDWAFASEEYLYYQKFNYSINILVKNGIMANKTAIAALKELERYGFIQKENNAYKGSGITQKWSFSSAWYTGEKRTY